MINEQCALGSFRDPSGSLVARDGRLFRRINKTYKEHYDFLTDSNLYETLVHAGLLIPHQEVDPAPEDLGDDLYKVIQPEIVPFVSYPYEWCFGQLKDAALATLRILEIALDHEMMLKDGTAFNIQFHRGRPLLIDTLSFEKYSEGTPWIAYRQFCQHFLAPLALMSYCHGNLGGLLRSNIDGIPLDVAAALLPKKSFLSLPMLFHIHLHAKAQKKYGYSAVRQRDHRLSKSRLRLLIADLKSAVTRLNWVPSGSGWADYYDNTTYSQEGFASKKRLVADFLDSLGPGSVWDIGSNTGEFSRLCASRGIPVISFESDLAASEKNYQACRKDNEDRILPLLLDITNPSPALGWANEERMSLCQRGPVDTVLALALIHHISIANNVPFDRVAKFFVEICRSLIIEFVPRSDSQAKMLLERREDIFSAYTAENFEKEFSRYFKIQRIERITHSERVLYLMTGK